jgi:Spy/CpxP family protein refolding chaperone
MKKKLLFSSLLVLLASSMVWSQPRFRMGRGDFMMGMGGSPVFRAIRHLDLSEEQKDAVQALREANREQLSPVMDELRENSQLLREATPETDILGIAERQGDLIAVVIAARAQLRFDFLALLTPEQVETLEQLKEERPGRGSRGPFGRGKRTTAP